ncbi:MAG: Uma2 family endonuclease [Microcoleus sp. PH2017_10_PVI_O_A]|uniref:Uma2 family endonuclease n=1 Tax=unclassified Microcoleus TaxID=2642155 RepID=UPI001D4184E6|nr:MULTISPECIES: Uma2 family endonuclease [unclassified Microcoleus]TAE84319.1 MAG: Uma2 family endonuclease [Oscillatoriales cyanobacterium]MCC3405509.1 Uma2 family endonuclease [Microcoleus sp. PH2017_10_PVI_O_A]MCC3461714.1 Uma2 family endonuclease [Microcoleus sp. PH2017_11_PCY_U_A]MCC3477611.1 Uma2 family endonuclease [Microcoleus sp. PH2017_12_PCY_D_A]MCC3558635.1 Uma2 family endonuclease [Microcoleus sp. PH2017_27_LUM_O_A]
MTAMTVKDLNQVQTLFSEAGLDYTIELEDGKISVMGPSDIVSSEISSRLIAFLFAWINPRRLGRVFDSAGGFIMPNTNVKAPDVSFVRATRLRQSPRYFGELVPDLVVEIKSQSDRIKAIETKVLKFIELGAVVGILIDPDEETVAIYRSTGEPIILANGDILTVPELFPGWELPVSELWPPIFTEEETQS